ncbi:5-formyltetrahydrofolate cyclo-ligase [Solwaraspora sp. WMMB335]|uniref:5-formyltetrahydrofolate cyclo-ligase n=1 Tax=Solwaraspora sp. WMMB335 TaxID=3404118 RepID=UPI003B941C27
MSDLPDRATDCSLTKDRLRTAILDRRRKLGERQVTAARIQVQATLRELVRHTATVQVAAYVPVGREPGGPDLPARLAELVGRSDQVLLPVLLADGDLDWAAFGGPVGLRGTGHGLIEPTGPRLGPSAVADAGLVVVPALAVDTRGVRLGRGGGSYDRALTRVSSHVPVVALLYDGEILAEVPAEPHDRPVTAAVTPAGLRRLPATSVRGRPPPDRGWPPSR